MGGPFSVATAAYDKDKDSGQRAFLALDFTPLLGVVWWAVLDLQARGRLSDQERAWSATGVSRGHP